MLKHTLAAFALAAFVAGPALASQCPGMMSEIDDALETAELDEAEMERVLDLRAEGEELHNAGDHDESVAVLSEAKEILGLE